MSQPKPRDEAQLRGLIRYHEIEANHFELHKETRLAASSRATAAKWRKELAALNPPPSPSVLIRDGKMLATGDKE